MNKKSFLVVFLAAVLMNAAAPAALAQTFDCSSNPGLTFWIQKNGLRYQPQNYPKLCDLTGSDYNKIEIPMNIKIQKVNGGQPPTVSRVWVVEKGESTNAYPAGDCSIEDTDADDFNICGYVENPNDGDTLTIEITRNDGKDFDTSKEPKFDVFAADIGVIDPRIAIIDTGTLRLHDPSNPLPDLVIDVVLDELGIQLSVGEDGNSFVVPGSKKASE